MLAFDVIRRPCSDSNIVTAPYKLSSYYYYYYYYTSEQGLIFANESLINVDGEQKVYSEVRCHDNNKLRLYLMSGYSIITVRRGDKRAELCNINIMTLQLTVFEVTTHRSIEMFTLLSLSSLLSPNI